MKNSELLLEVLGETDERFVPELWQQRRRVRPLLKPVLGGLFAAAAIALIAGTQIYHAGREKPLGTVSGGQEKIRCTQELDTELDFGTMGFEGLMAYDISELDVPVPDVSGLSELPVYRSLAESGADMSGITVFLSEEDMKKAAQRAADLLGETITDTDTTAAEGGICRIDCLCSSKTVISVEGSGKTTVFFQGKELPEGYEFTYSGTDHEQAEKVLEYLCGEYGELTGLDDPVWYSYADRTFGGEEDRTYQAYEHSADPAEELLSFSLGGAEFAPDDEGRLMVIRYNDPLQSLEYIGHCSLISPEQAAQSLKAGKHQSSVPADFLKTGQIREEDIARTDMVYKISAGGQCLPYYRFYIELDADQFSMAQGLKNYGIFYVPAVEQ